MPGDRWPDKRARAVLFAGANRIAKEQPERPFDPDAVADTGLAVRELLFTDDEVREDTADVKAHRIGYTADCMQYATLEPAPEEVLLSLWLGPQWAEQARSLQGAEDHPNAFRKLYGWVRFRLDPATDPAWVAEWVGRARRHAAETKAKQQVSM